MFKFPEIKGSQVAVAQVETCTGILLDIEGRRHLGGGGDVYRVFKSLEEARSFSLSRVDEFPEIECIIFGALGDELEVVRPKWV